MTFSKRDHVTSHGERYKQGNQPANRHHHETTKNTPKRKPQNTNLRLFCCERLLTRYLTLTPYILLLPHNPGVIVGNLGAAPRRMLIATAAVVPDTGTTDCRYVGVLFFFILAAAVIRALICVFRTCCCAVNWAMAVCCWTAQSSQFWFHAA